MKLVSTTLPLFGVFTNKGFFFILISCGWSGDATSACFLLYQLSKILIARKKTFFSATSPSSLVSKQGTLRLVIAQFFLCKGIINNTVCVIKHATSPSAICKIFCFVHWETLLQKKYKKFPQYHHTKIISCERLFTEFSRIYNISQKNAPQFLMEHFV